MKSVGRPPGAWMKFFEEVSSGGKTIVRCIFCVQAHTLNPMAVAAAVTLKNRKDALIPNLRRCTRVPAHRQQEVLDIVKAYDSSSTAAASVQTGGTNSVLPCKRPANQMSLVPWVNKPITKQQKPELHELLLECAIDNKSAFNFVGSCSFKRLMQFVRPSVMHALPSPSTLGGSILSQVGAKAGAEGRNKLDVLVKKGAIPGLIMDDWENVSKEHLTGVTWRPREHNGCTTVVRVALSTMALHWRASWKNVSTS
eukprot:GHVU01210501.1.p1 GENE.GHVU01210501.1~~GHVU01210501.1.p1  ORF type:complete len:254 (-),score=10.65 GHVU01210501.1:890-1651(-)